MGMHAFHYKWHSFRSRKTENAFIRIPVHPNLFITNVPSYNNNAMNYLFYSSPLNLPGNNKLSELQSLSVRLSKASEGRWAHPLKIAGQWYHHVSTVARHACTTSDLRRVESQHLLTRNRPPWYLFHLCVDVLKWFNGCLLCHGGPPHVRTCCRSILSV